MFNKELNINYIGIREGEKMDETLATREEVAKSEDRNTYLGDLRKYLSQYSSVEKWRDSLLSIYNQDGDQVWLPTSISPSKGVWRI